MMNEEGMRRALHRSVWFWLGCFVLVFLLWVWADSLERKTWVRRVWGLGIRSEYGEKFEGFYVDGVSVNGGWINISWCRPTIRGAMRWGRYLPLGVERGTATVGMDWAEWPTVSRDQDDFAEGGKVVEYQVEVPMWGIVGLYGVVFAGVMVWRRRRVRTSNIERPTSNDGVGGFDEDADIGFPDVSRGKPVDRDS